MTGYIPRWFICPRTVIHPSTNLAVHGQESNSQPVDHKSDALPTALASQLCAYLFSAVTVIQVCVDTETANRKEKKKRKEEPSSVFQRQRVDMLLTELAQKFPPKSFPVAHQVQPVAATAGSATDKTGNVLQTSFGFLYTVS